MPLFAYTTLIHLWKFDQAHDSHKFDIANKYNTTAISSLFLPPSPNFHKVIKFKMPTFAFNPVNRIKLRINICLQMEFRRRYNLFYGLFQKHILRHIWCSCNIQNHKRCIQWSQYFFPQLFSSLWTFIFCILLVFKNK